MVETDDIKGAVRIEDTGRFSPTSLTGRDYAGHQKMVYKRCFPGTSRSLDLDDISPVQRGQRRRMVVYGRKKMGIKSRDVC